MNYTLYPLLVTLISIILITLLDGKLIPFGCNFHFTNLSLNQLTFTEHSSSLIDIILVTNKENLNLSCVADPFINKDVRFPCLVNRFLKFSKHRFKAKGYVH